MVRFVPMLYQNIKKPSNLFDQRAFERSRADSNRCRSFCRALPSHSATRPKFRHQKFAFLMPKVIYSAESAGFDFEEFIFSFNALNASKSPRVDFSDSWLILSTV